MYSALSRRTLLATRPRINLNTRLTSVGSGFNLSPLARHVANSVSGKPPSDNLPHFIQNAKEEAASSTAGLAQTIAGGAANTQFGSTAKDAPLNAGFLGYTSAIASSVPKPVMAWGLAGALPYLGSSATSLWFANQAGQVASGVVTNVDYATAMALMEQSLNVQTTYGAVLLSFLGALHWGMEFVAYGGQKGTKRLALGVVPTVVAWYTLSLDPTTALVSQWCAFTALWYADMKATTAGWTPVWYSQYRFYLSILVGGCIITTLAGTSYFGPTTSHSKTQAEHRAVRERKSHKVAEDMQKPVAPGEVGSILGEEEGSEAYVLIRHAKNKEEEEKEKKEKEKQEKQGNENDKDN